MEFMKREQNMNRMAVIMCLAAGVVLAGCGKKAEDKLSEKLTEKLLEKSLSRDGVKADVDLSGETMSFTTTDAEGKQAHVQLNNEEMTITGEDGQTTFRAAGAGKMPEDFPADVYVPAGASVVSSLATPAGINLALKTSAAAKDVAAQYAAEMKTQGWTSQSSMDMGDMTMLAFAKDNRTANVIVQSADGTTSINLTVATQ